jgi:hypothetical protein
MFRPVQTTNTKITPFLLQKAWLSKKNGLCPILKRPPLIVAVPSFFPYNRLNSRPNTLIYLFKHPRPVAAVQTATKNEINSFNLVPNKQISFHRREKAKPFRSRFLTYLKNWLSKQPQKKKQNNKK